MTALATSPFLTLAFGMASLTETMMMSPTEAYLRFEPPSTLMQKSFLAPELSATSKMLVIWIMAVSSRLFRTLEQLLDAPPFFARERARFDHQHLVARARFVFLVVSLVLHTLGHELLVGLVLDAVGDDDDASLHHLVGRHHADHRAARAP